MPGPASWERSRNFPLRSIPVEKFWFAECVAETFAVEFGIDVAVGHEDIGPAVVVDVEEERAPSQEL